MSRLKKLGLIAIAVLLPAVPVLAADPPKQSQLDQAKLVGLETERKSIADRVASTQQTLQIATAKIDETNRQVGTLTGESQALVPDLEARTIVYQRKLSALKDAVSIDYKNEHPNGVELLVQDGSVTETLTKGTYLQAMQDKIDRLAAEAERAYDELHDRKTALDQKRSTLEVLQRQLNSLRQTISQQEAELKELLANRDNEAAYLADKIKREQLAEAALLGMAGEGGALWGSFSDGARVRAGDIIGLEGSTGNSTGCHTHFSVIKGGQWVDPRPFLDGGILRRPEGSLTQPFGMTDWARGGAYGGRIHNGLDIVQGCGAGIRAAESGVIIRDNRTDGSGFGHYVMIRHDNGLITLYGHLI